MRATPTQTFATGVGTTLALDASIGTNWMLLTVPLFLLAGLNAYAATRTSKETP